MSAHVRFVAHCPPRAGLPSHENMYIPPRGAAALIWPRNWTCLRKRSRVFINNTARGLDAVVRPGDKVAFISSGVPGAHRYSLGIHAARKASCGVNKLI
ncbi:MAG: MoaD/ThiS family protein [Syntrophotaleaceae bacterium]